MKFFPLVWSNLKRRKVRTFFTIAAIFAAFFLFGYLSAIRVAFGMGVDVVGVDRLSVIHKTAIIMPLPISYKERIASVPGVEAVTHLNWFGGIYQDPKNFFPQMAVDTDTMFDLYRELIVPREQIEAWKADQTGAIVGKATMDRFGWKIGDRVPIQGTIFRKQDGSPLWEFTIRGVYTGREKEVDTSSFYFHYDYLNQAARGGNLGFVGWYVIRIADPAQGAAIAKKIDSMFANSPAETKTQSEKALAQSFANQVGNIAFIVNSVSAVAFFMLLLIVGNTMAQSVRERTSEMAVLKTLGFTHRQVLGLVLAESCLLALLGAALGLGIVWALIAVAGDPTNGQLPVFFLPGKDLALGVAIAVVFGLATGTLPAWQAMRLRIVDALRRV
jgi:putative ABC transport system permease protein